MLKIPANYTHTARPLTTPTKLLWLSIYLNGMSSEQITKILNTRVKHCGDWKLKISNKYMLQCMRMVI